MTESQKMLAKRLLYLSLDLHEKVLLWLSYRGLKPVSGITVERRNIALLRRGIKTSPPNIKNKINRIRKWVHDADLHYATEPGYPNAWHVGRDKNQVTLSAKILHRFDYKSEYQSGILFGFPIESAKAYAHNRILKPGENRISMIKPFEFSPYQFFSTRADHGREDGQIAKVWESSIRKDVPLLAKWYEEYSARQRSGKFREK